MFIFFPDIGAPGQAAQGMREKKQLRKRPPEYFLRMQKNRPPQPWRPSGTRVLLFCHFEGVAMRTKKG
jgi:hypothetical protein